MAIHHKRKEKAETLILKLQVEQMLPEQITAELLAKKYTEEELKEIAGGAYAPTPAESIQQTNTAETTIISDEKPLVAQKSGRIHASAADNGGFVYLHNAATGITQYMPADGAKRLIRNNPEQYSLRDGKK